MIEQFFEEYNISESELKTYIFKTLSEIYSIQPNDDLYSLLQRINNNPSTAEIVNLILNPDYEKLSDQLNSGRLTELDLLRISAYKIDFELDEIKLRNLLIRQTSRNYFNLFYGTVFVFIAMILVEKQQIEIDFDRDLVYEHIFKQPKDLVELFDVLRASIFVKSLMEKFASDNANNFFIEKINQFSDSVSDYVEANATKDSYIAVVGLVMEANAKFLDSINADLQLGEPLTNEERKGFLELLSKIKKQITKERIGYEGRGGRRERKGFKWVDSENKIRFYKTVENLPKIKGISLWEYAYENVKENDFHYKYIDYLKSLPEFQNAPKELFQNAIITWQKYKDSFSEPKADEKPLSFAFQHALYLLDFPDTKYSSLKRYYGEGKKLFKTNSLDKEKSK